MNAITARIKKADPLFVPHLIRCGEWEAYYEGLLASLGTSRVVFVDFDLTAFERDALRALNEGYSQIDSRFGVPRWRIFERAYLEGGAKIDGEFRSLSGGEHLQISYADLLRRTSLDDLVAYAAGNVPLVPGFKDFVRRLRRQGIAVVGITHGVWQIAQAVLSENG